MTPEQIAEWARIAGATTQHYGTLPDGRNLFLGAKFTTEQLARFAELVAAHEREQCREVVEECVRTQAHIAANAREALSEASARIYKRGRATAQQPDAPQAPQA